ncbi:hypothetical protein [Pseudonocardia adelaidensis]|uniref:Uncharacterized protein n=1 Tax=Pseudonocardia adelaidensis TaxID=648754 RepID=A0ABP9NKC6_9PSEU
MWEYALFFLGIVVQLGGVALTIKGARQVWTDVASPDDRFLAPFIHAGRWIVRSVRRLIGRPAPHVAGGSAAAGLALAASARGYGLPGSVPDGLSVEEQIALVNERLIEHLEKVHKTMFRIQDELEAEIQKTKAAHVAAIAAVDDRTEHERKRAVNGIRIEAYGFIFLTIGTLIQAFGSYLGIGS